MKHAARIPALAAGAALAIACTGLTSSALAAPQESAPTPRTVRVRGTQIPVNLALGQYRMTGDLVGNWQYNPVSPPMVNTPTLYVEVGTEEFVGCIDRNHNGRCDSRDHNGTMTTAFIYWARYTDDPSHELVEGRCVHPITGGTGAFAGARGVVDMLDTNLGDGLIRTTYRGTVELGAVPSEAGPSGIKAAAAPAPAKVSATTTGVRRGC